MEKIIDFLRQVLPLQVTVLIIFFVYLIWLIKQLAEKYIDVAEKQTLLADAQAKYIQDRLLTVEKTLGITEKAIDLRDRHISELEALNTRRDKTIADSESSLRASESRLSDMEKQYQEAVRTMGLKDSQIEALKNVHGPLLDATREETFVLMQYNIRSPLGALRDSAGYVRRHMNTLPKETLHRKLQDIELDSEIIFHQLQNMEFLFLSDIKKPGICETGNRIREAIQRTMHHLNSLVRDRGLDPVMISCDLQALSGGFALCANPSWIAHVIHELFICPSYDLI